MRIYCLFAAVTRGFYCVLPLFEKKGLARQIPCQNNLKKNELVFRKLCNGICSVLLHRLGMEYRWKFWNIVEVSPVAVFHDALDIAFWSIATEESYNLRIWQDIHEIHKKNPRSRAPQNLIMIDWLISEIFSVSLMWKYLEVGWNCKLRGYKRTFTDFSSWKVRY